MIPDLSPEEWEQLYVEVKASATEIGVRQQNQKTFWAACPSYYQVTADLRNDTTEYCHVYVDVDATVDQAIVDRWASEFSDAIYGGVTDTFGDPPDVDNDPKIYILLLDIPEDRVGGYFWPAQETSFDHIEIIYIDALIGDEGVVAHEFQHCVHWNHDADEETWVDEGCADYAIYAVYHQHETYGHAKTFLNDPDIQLTSWDGTIGDYGASYLWTLYLSEKYGDLSGSGGHDHERFIKDLVAEEGNGIEGINNVLSDHGYAERFPDIFNNWVIANYLNDMSLSDLYGYTTYPGIHANATTRDFGGGEDDVSGAVNEWAADYVKLDLANVGTLKGEFTGDGPSDFKVHAVPASASGYEVIETPLSGGWVPYPWYGTYRETDSGELDNLTVIVAGHDQGWSGTGQYTLETTGISILNILKPTEAAPVNAGSNNDPIRTTLEFEINRYDGVFIPELATDRFKDFRDNLTVEIGGKQASVLTIAEKTDRYVMEVAPPEQGAGGKYDLSICIDSVCDLERDAIDYDGGSGGGGDIDITPAEIDLQLPPDAIASVALAICNNGTGDPEYNVSVSYMATATDCDVTATSKAAWSPEGVKKQVGAIAAITATPSASEIAISADKEIGYDDGEADGAYQWDTAGCGVAVHFTSLDYDTLKTARFYLEINESAPDNSFDWSVLGWTGSTPGSEIGSGMATPVSDGWYDLDMGGITVPDNFVIAMYWRQGGVPSIGYDSDPPIGRRSWDYTDGWSPWHAEDYMIRAVMVDGGGWLSVDKTSGTVAPGSCDEITVTIDATDLNPGDYSAKIVISSNDLDEDPVTVPVTLTVSESKLMEGDVNGDGCVSLKDSTAIKLYLVDERDLDEDRFRCADTLDDGEVNLKDSTLIRKWLVDKSTPLWESPADAGMAKPETC
ncbi:MAG: dockerin type I domain-containing protein [Euryarchaeota archaeon]|nr:dockerin type I domain-containing protein [Euryarchaeota archaeon]